MIETSLEAVVQNIQVKYNSESKSLTRDITNALIAALQISKLIVCSSQLHFQQKGINISEGNLVYHKNS